MRDKGPNSLDAAGSMRDATVAPKIAPSMFPEPTTKIVNPSPTHQPNMSRRRVENIPMQRKRSVTSDDFGDLDFDDDAMVKASDGDLDFAHIDNFADPVHALTRSNTAKNKPALGKGFVKAAAIKQDRYDDDDDTTPVQLPNGRWSCNHKCKDKEACKHYCCKHGLDRPPKKAISKRAPMIEQHGELLSGSAVRKSNKTQTKLQLQVSKRKSSAAIEELDLTQQEKKRKNEYAINGQRDYNDLPDTNAQKDVSASLYSFMKKKPAYCYGEGGEHQLSFLSQPCTSRPKTSSDYGDAQFEDFTAGLPASQNEFPSSDNITSPQSANNKAHVASCGSDTFGDDDSIFGEVIVGLEDSQDLQVQNKARIAIHAAEDSTDVDFPMDLDFTANENVSPDLPKQAVCTALVQDRNPQPVGTRAPFLEATSSPEQPRFKPAKSLPQDRSLRGLQQGKTVVSSLHQAAWDEDEYGDVYSDILEVLDMPLAANDKKNTTKANPLTKVEAPVHSVETVRDETEQIPEGFKNLQPWLFQEFGDIVELIDE